jgi:glyoxylase-like metal-dependent hydrolase (beta-lactamase superfamily II)
MNIKTFELGPVSTNAFVFWKEGLDEAVLVDAPHGAWETVNYFLKQKGLKLKALVITHGHWDHIADAKKFRDEGAMIYAHKGDRGWIEDPTPMNVMLPAELHFEGTKIDHLVEQGEILHFLDLDFEVRHVPGHAPGSILIYNELNKMAFSGDVLFSGSIGRYDLPGADFETLKRSIQTQVYTLPEDTVLYVGHGPTTTVKKEKYSNPFVKA